MALILSISWPVAKIGLTLAPPLNFTLHRLMLSALALSPLLIFLVKKIPHDQKTVLKLSILAICSALSLAATCIGLVYEASGISAILTYTQPLFVFCLSALRSEAKIAKLAGILVGFCGIVVFSIGPSNQFEIIGSCFLITGAFLWAVATVYYKQALGHVDPFVTSVLQQALGAVLLVPLVSAFEGFSFPLTAVYTQVILWLSVFGNGVTVVLWFFLVREEDVVAVSSSGFLVPLMAIFFGWVLLREPLGPRVLLGMVLILTGVYVVNRP
jgi:drug/metabolite transporter (DMT)-like permease